MADQLLPQPVQKVCSESPPLLLLPLSDPELLLLIPFRGVPVPVPFLAEDGQAEELYLAGPLDCFCQHHSRSTAAAFRQRLETRQRQAVRKVSAPLTQA
jgi:hypothetical protein